MKFFYFCVCYQYFFLFNLTEVQKKKVMMPKIRKFRDLSRRQQNRRLLIQRKNENIFISREHTVIHNTQNSIECPSKNINLNTIELSSNISDVQIDISDVQTDIQPENDYYSEFA